MFRFNWLAFCNFPSTALVQWGILCESYPWDHGWTYEGKKKEVNHAHNAQIHGAMSVASVARVSASSTNENEQSKNSMVVTSVVAALVAAQWVEVWRLFRIICLQLWDLLLVLRHLVILTHWPLFLPLVRTYIVCYLWPPVHTHIICVDFKVLWKVRLWNG